MYRVYTKYTQCQHACPVLVDNSPLHRRKLDNESKSLKDFHSKENLRGAEVELKLYFHILKETFSWNKR